MARYNVGAKVISKVDKKSFTRGTQLCFKGDTLEVIEILGLNYTVRNTNRRMKGHPFYIKDIEVQ